ncbi:MAG: hypothetical protein M3024_11040 [Candidatus Dormibacteraeota bacterium]|nr:hypothetical protein [Candidatus Dormibacteraeota bacterium]
MAAKGPIEHVVIVVQENHTFDNYFSGFPGADGDLSLPVSPNPPPKDPDHRHAAWLNRATGATRARFTEAMIPTYWDWARRYTLCQRYYTEVAGPSTPNHLMLIAAASPVIDNPPGAFGGHRPSFPMATLPGLLLKAGLTWANYGGYAFELIPETAARQLPSAQFATDAAAGRLATVSWLYAPAGLDEHAPDTAAQRAAGHGNVTKGSEWVRAQVAAVVAGGLWNSTAIFVTWDDWGGWADHVVPPELERWTDGTQFRLGSRVGCLVLSAYAKVGHLSSVQTSHVSLVAFCEEQFGLPHLNAVDAAADPMSDCFDFTQPPLPPPPP